MHMHQTTLPSALPCACTSLRKAARAVSRIYDEALGEAGLNASQFAILRATDRAGPSGIGLSRLAEQLVMDRTSLYRALKPLAREDWVRVENSAAGRAKNAFLTAAGRVKAVAAALLWEAAQTRMVGEFGSTRWDALAPELVELTGLAVRLGR